MAHKVLRFAGTYMGQNREYVFPDIQGGFSTNFGDLVPRTSRLIGVSGGFDGYGGAPAPQSVGRVQFGFTLIAQTRAEMDAKRDTLKQLSNWGVQRLYIQPSDQATPERYCYARLNNINMAQRLDEHTNLWQPVQLVFQVSDPRWISEAGAQSRWGQFRWGVGRWAATSGFSQSVNANTDNTYTVYLGGSAPVYPLITLTPEGANYERKWKLERLTSETGDRLYGVHCDGSTVSGADEIDTEADDFSPSLWTDSGLDVKSWPVMKLEPGANYIRIANDSTTTDFMLSMTWTEAYI
jgi:hypothetical protein